MDNLEIWDETVKRGIFDSNFEYPNPLNGNRWSENYKNVFKNFSKLASYTDAHNIFNVIKNHQVILLTMGTGAGKTVMMPKLMMHYYAYQKKVAITIPRKAITEDAAIYGAKTLDCELGKEVGYQHGSEKKFVNPNTKLLYTTDGTIKAKITTSDPDLLEYNCIIIDEAHERNVNIDLLFSLLKDLCKRRPEFRLVIMSATVDTNVFKVYFEKNGLIFKHYHVPTQDDAPKFSIDKIFLKKEIDKKESTLYIQKYIDQILTVTTEGDIIAFVHSLTPAYAIIEGLEKNRSKYHGNPVFIGYAGSSDKSQKDLATTKDDETGKPYYMTKGYTRCVIITTPALESSFTAPGKMVYVIDGGLTTESWYDPVKFADVLETVYAPQSSIVQRQGRTGRICSGQAYMMYTKELFDSLPEYADPLILKSDLTSDIISIMNLPSIRTLPRALHFMSNMITPPTVESIESGIKLLYNYSLLSSKGTITELGKTSVKLGRLGPELSRMVLVSYYYNCMEDVILLAAMMLSTQKKDLGAIIREPSFKATKEEKDNYKNFMARFKHPRGDHFILINILKAYLMVHELDREKWCIKLNLNYELFKKTIEYDLMGIRDSLQNIEFPQMFTHIPPPPKMEKPPKDLVEYLQRKNQAMRDAMYGDQLPQDRFQFKYGGANKEGKTKEHSKEHSKEKAKTPKEELEIKLKGLKQSFKKTIDDFEFESVKSSRESNPVVINLIPTKNSSRIDVDFNFENTSNFINEKINGSNASNSSNSSYKIITTVKNKKTRKLLGIIHKKYTKHHLKDLEIDEDLKKVLLMDNHKFNQYQFKKYLKNINLNHKKNLDNFENSLILNGEYNEEYDKNYEKEQIEMFNINKKKTEKQLENEDLKNQIENQKIIVSLNKLKQEHPSKFISSNSSLSNSLNEVIPRTYKKKYITKQKKNFDKNIDKNIKITKKKTRRYKKNIDSYINIHLKEEELKKEKEFELEGGFKDENEKINPSVLEEERKKFGNFLDEISLKTESGILPTLRIFEDPDENIMACIYYGFYMKLAVNFYQNKYLVKLSKIDTSITSGYFNYNFEKPDLVIYQNLSISNNQCKLGLVCKLSPRIINSFI